MISKDIHNAEIIVVSKDIHNAEIIVVIIIIARTATLRPGTE